MRPGMPHRAIATVDPFAVLGQSRGSLCRGVSSRTIRRAPPSFTAWDNEWREEAQVRDGLRRRLHRVPDGNRCIHLFFLEQLGAPTRPSVAGLPAEDVWTCEEPHGLQSEARPQKLHYESSFRGFQPVDRQTPTGGTRDYWEFHWKAIFGGRHTFSEGYYMKDAWGPYDFYQVSSM